MKIDRLKIGRLQIDVPLLLAPMAGITTLPFRRLAKDAGCGMVVSEMVSANGLVYGSDKTMELLRSHPCERPLSIQIFGTDAAVMSSAAQMVESQGADAIDINLGCSVRKIVRQGAGVALMREPARLESILRSVRNAVSVPLTIKIRSGWDVSGTEAFEVVRIAQECGVDAITVHPRTARQGFGGRADWTIISRIKEVATMPIIGNGDVRTADDVLRMQQQTGCDAVMIGRAAMGNPWIFSEILDTLQSRPHKPCSLSERHAVIVRYVDYSIENFGEIRASRMMRSHLSWFVKGLPGCSDFRSGIIRVTSRNDIIDILSAYFENLKQADL